MRPEVVAVLLEYEVARSIADCLAADWFHSGYGDLVRLALTCRGFYNPAMDSLWYSIDALTPLLHCFSSPVRAIMAEGEFAWRLSRTPCTSDWDRFLSYAARVRELHLNYENPNQAGEAAYDVIALHRPVSASPLFPNLHTISWNSANDIIDPYISLFISASLQDLSMAVNSNISATNLFDTLQFNAPRLRHLDIDTDNFDASRETYDALKDAMYSWPAIETFRINGRAIMLEAKEILHLSRLSSLTTVTIPLNVTSGFDTSMLKTNDLFFPSLRVLDLVIGKELDDIFLAQTVIHRITSFTVREIILDLPLVPSEPVVRNLFSNVAKHLQLEKIQVVPSSSHRKAIEENFLEVLLSCSTLDPLLDIPTIREVDIQYLPFDLYSEDIEKIANAWPHLQELQLGIHCICPDFTPCLPFTSLTAFKVCPDLTRVGLTFDKHLPDESAVWESVGLKVQVVDIGRTYVDDSMPWPLAEYMVDLFPNIIMCYGRVDLDGVDSEYRERTLKRLWADIEIVRNSRAGDATRERPA
ncbi:hypothetical protein K474DRAFT_1705646 [Panus rudis PR-1116 ss-1]|nr:hypothetical protein K474DRAFT_1705646 [Panus rudis PR-1116 ss-1]